MIGTEMSFAIVSWMNDARNETRRVDKVAPTAYTVPNRAAWRNPDPFVFAALYVQFRLSRKLTQTPAQ
jgi:hypothetical protein